MPGIYACYTPNNEHVHSARSFWSAFREGSVGSDRLGTMGHFWHSDSRTVGQRTVLFHRDSGAESYIRWRALREGPCYTELAIRSSARERGFDAMYRWNIDD